MAIIDLVRWVPEGNTTIYAWRYPETNLSTYTQLIVQESQEAVLFSKGKIVGKFGPGKHTLNTENLPILHNLFGLPFGGKNPFTAEVWFVNKIQTFNINWTVYNMAMHDADYNTQLPLMARGQYGVKIVDAEKFLIKIVGTKSEYTESDLTDQFMGEFTTKTKSTILQYMLKHRIGYKEISAYLDSISEYLGNVLKSFWDDLGLDLMKFYVSDIEIDDTTPEGKKVKEAIAQQSSMFITGHTWQQEKMLETANNAIGGMGQGTGGMLGGLMAINMMGGMGGGNLGGLTQPQFNQPSFNGQNGMNGQNGIQQPQQPVKMVYCSNCSKKYPSTSKFCPYCGDPYNPCPNCGTDNDVNAKRCVSCGYQLQGGNEVCPYCNAPVAPGSTFCGNCGKQLKSNGDTCSRCGAKLAPNTKFCPICGNKIF